MIFDFIQSLYSDKQLDFFNELKLYGLTTSLLRTYYHTKWRTIERICLKESELLITRHPEMKDKIENTFETTSK